MLLPNFTNKYPLVDIIKIIQNQAIFAPLEGQGLMWRRKEAGDGDTAYPHIVKYLDCRSLIRVLNKTNPHTVS